MKTAVIYARYSSSNQTEQSIEGQVHVCQDFAKKRISRSRFFGYIRRLLLAEHNILSLGVHSVDYSKRLETVSEISYASAAVLEALLDKYMNTGIYEIEKTGNEATHS